VAGNPARVVKYRFPEVIIQELLKINYARITPKHMSELGLILYKTHETPDFSAVLAQLIQLSDEEIPS
jgi:hypothetical protein